MPEVSISQVFEQFRVSELESVLQTELARGRKAIELVQESQEAMEKIGKKFNTGDYYLAELILSANMFKRLSIRLTPLLSQGKCENRTIGKIVLGTAKGDIHDLGKDIFGSLAAANGFQVVDIGVDVEPAKFVEVIKIEKPEIVGISALITTAFPGIKKVVDLLEEEGLRGTVKIIIGGGAVGEQTQRFVGADAFTLDANDGVRICKDFITASE
jgi:methanogenic corrinoid protein MtbC1